MIKLNNRLSRIENLEDLLFVSLGILGDFGAGQLLARLGLTGRVADHSGEIADEKNHRMAELLELLHFLDQHRMTQMQIRRRGIESSFYAQRSVPFEFGDQ